MEFCEWLHYWFGYEHCAEALLHMTYIWSAIVIVVLANDLLTFDVEEIGNE